MNTTTATATIPTSYIFIYNGETLAGGEIVGDYAYAERRREGLAAFCGVYPWEIQIKKR
jgi:hypothetical protein